MALNTPKLDKAVEDFKKVCDPHWQLYRYGQFYVSNRTVDDLAAQIEINLKANIRFQFAPEDLPPLLAFFKKKLGGIRVDKIDVPSILAMLDVIEKNGDMGAIRDMFKPTKADRANAQSDFDTLWSSKDLPSNPIWAGTASLPKARAAREIEKDRCWQVLRSMARMLLKKRAIGPLPPAARVSTGLLAGASAPNVTPQRQEVIYSAPAELAAAVVKIKAVIDAGGYVHCGLLSGALHEKSKFPQPEHHVLAFAYDTVEGQDAFLFWDPDCFRSNINGLPWGKGFGLLFSRAKRLCTGVDDADLAGIDVDPNSDTFGDHNTRDQVRHCYQVYTLQSLPMKAALKLHTKVLSAPTSASVDDMLDNAVWLYAAHDIELHEASREVIDPGSDLDRYQTLFTGDRDTGPSDQLTALHGALRDRREKFGVEPASEEAVVAFVGELVPAARGSVLSPPDQPGIVLSAASAGEWTLAHEIGRLAGLEVAPVPGRLMSASTAGLGDPELTEVEAQTVLASPLAEA